MSISSHTEDKYFLSFKTRSVSQAPMGTAPYVETTLYKCPDDACGKISVIVRGYRSDEFNKIHTTICPPIQCMVFPFYVPSQIRQDYEEACAIKELSPKASATLSRRCLQGMIRDFWEIKDKNTLHQEIEAIRGKIDDNILDALFALKSIGNVGAHSEVDVNMIVEVEPDEAKELITLVEFLISDWYVGRENRNKLIGSITSINRIKQEQRKQP